jgi:hypothetical protein
VEPAGERLSRLALGTALAALVAGAAPAYAAPPPSFADVFPAAFSWAALTAAADSAWNPAPTPAPSTGNEATAPRFRDPYGIGPHGKIAFWWDHYRDSNDDNLDDFSVFASYKQAYIQVWSGEYTDGVEVGGYLRDSRKSTYSAFYRYRHDFDHIVQLETDQVLAHGFVWVGQVRFIHVIPADAEGGQDQIQYGTGFDWYHGDYDFLTFRAISDPRVGGRWTFQLSHRFYHGTGFYIEPAILPRTDGTTNWFVRGKYKYLVWLVGDFNQFDFSDIERKQLSLGIEFPW